MRRPQLFVVWRKYYWSKKFGASIIASGKVLRMTFIIRTIRPKASKKQEKAWNQNKRSLQTKQAKASTKTSEGFKQNKQKTLQQKNHCLFWGARLYLRPQWKSICQTDAFQKGKQEYRESFINSRNENNDIIFEFWKLQGFLQRKSGWPFTAGLELTFRTKWATENRACGAITGIVLKRS